MARPKYVLTKADGFTTWKWLEDKMRTSALDCSKNARRSSVARRALEATNYGKKYTVLNDWAETYLTTKE